MQVKKFLPMPLESIQFVFHALYGVHIGVQNIVGAASLTDIAPVTVAHDCHR